MKNVLKVFTLFVCLFFIGSKAFAQNPSSLVLEYKLGSMFVIPTDVTVTYDQTTAFPGQPPLTLTGLQRTVHFSAAQTQTVTTVSSGYTQFKITSMTFSFFPGNQANAAFFSQVNDPANLGMPVSVSLNTRTLTVTLNSTSFLSGANYTFKI